MKEISRRKLLLHGLGAIAGAGAVAGAAPAGPVSGVGATPLRSDPGSRLFGIRVVDAQTGRGVPLVELKTDNHIRVYTDSAGRVAIDDPGLMRGRVYFFVSSPGYAPPAKDAFGYSGIALNVTPGGAATVKLRRTDIAGRMYRITGEGIYADTVRLGHGAPTRHPVLNGRVMGQDSALATVYQEKIHWIWGDTARPDYPLGNFRSSGAVSDLPNRGGLHPDMGVNLNYFVDKTGFCRAMCPLPGEPKGVVWLDGLTVAPDKTGRPRMLARFSRRDGMKKVYEHGLAVWNDKSQIFQRHGTYPIGEHWRFPAGHPADYQENGRDYKLFSGQLPVVRCPATLEAIANPAEYEAFTCLAPGARFQGRKTKMHRGANGSLLWAWKRSGTPLSQAQEAQLITFGLIKPHEARFQFIDVETKATVRIHNGSFFWNAHLKKWIMIGGQQGGTSFLGEIWFAAAAEPTGPWKLARKVATHPDYSFYNPAQNPFFDQEGGRIIYFQGTYSVTFSGNAHPTPRYDYNQLMYRLDLADRRLADVA